MSKAKRIKSAGDYAIGYYKAGNGSLEEAIDWGCRYSKIKKLKFLVRLYTKRRLNESKN